MTDPEALVDELGPLVQSFSPEPCAIALGGSLAKGGGDAHSDLDIYVFARRVLDGAARTARVAAALGSGSEAVSWGQDEPFVQGGTDFVHRDVRVECWLRNPEQVESTLLACGEGRITREYVPWTVMGFFSYAVLGDLQAMRIVADPEGMLARWKAAVDPYPERLRRAVVHRFLAEAALWPDNPHYRTAVDRGDALYTSGIVQRVVQALVQVLFALNHEYFPGEKRLKERLATLPTAPAEAGARIQALLFPGGEPDPARLEEQRRELGALVAEVQRLARRQAGRGRAAAQV